MLSVLSVLLVVTRIDTWEISEPMSDTTSDKSGKRAFACKSETGELPVALLAKRRKKL